MIEQSLNAFSMFIFIVRSFFTLYADVEIYIKLFSSYLVWVSSIMTLQDNTITIYQIITSQSTLMWYNIKILYVWKVQIPL